VAAFVFTLNGASRGFDRPNYGFAKLRRLMSNDVSKSQQRWRKAL